MCVLYDVLEFTHGKWPGAGPFSYVDDIAQTTRGYESGILRELGAAGVRMAKELEKAGCVISAKSVLVASNARLGKRPMEVFSKNGIVMNHDRAPRDLGVANTAGKRRSLWMVRQRLSKACARNNRVQHLVRRNRRASKLYRTGTYPAATYGRK